MADEYSNEFPLEVDFGNEEPLFTGGSPSAGPSFSFANVAAAYASGAITAAETRKILDGKGNVIALNLRTKLNNVVPFGRDTTSNWGWRPSEPYRFAFKNYGNIDAPVRFYATGEKSGIGMVVLPVPPETMKWSSANGIQEVSSIAGLSFVHGGVFPLEEITLEGFFPFLTQGSAKPDWIPLDTFKHNFYNAPVLVKKFVAAMNAAQPIRFIISDPSTSEPIFPATPMVVTGFQYEYRFGHGRDVFWTMTLKKWNPQRLSATTTAKPPTNTTGGTTGGGSTGGSTGGNGGIGTVPPGTPPPVPTTTRPGNPPQVTKYVIKSGDTLWGIADRFLGNGSKWPTIFELNKKVLNDALKARGQKFPNPNLIYPGTVLQIPKK